MTSAHDGDWTPSPELLAAYFDGELEGRDDAISLRQRLEKWLAANPGGRTELVEYRHLRHLWQETTPREPSRTSWQTIQKNIVNRHQVCSPHQSNRQKIMVLWAGAACILLAAFFLRDRTPVSVDGDQPFPVATEEDVVILRVEGADTGTLVVGLLPVQGALELVGPGDVKLTSVTPSLRDKLVPELHDAGPGPPIIWARAEAEED